MSPRLSRRNNCKRPVQRKGLVTYWETSGHGFFTRLFSKYKNRTKTTEALWKVKYFWTFAMTLCVMLPKVKSPTELVSTSCSSKKVGTTLDKRPRTTIFDIHHSISYHIFEFHYKRVAKKFRWVTCVSIHCDRGKHLTKTALSRFLVEL